MIDDIQDQSTLRRNQPCWYLHNDIGLAAINDGLMIENIMYRLLQKHFSEKDCYVDLLELFQGVSDQYLTLSTVYASMDASNECKKAIINLYSFNQGITH